MNTQYRYVRYHSCEWALLVETGWVTMFVDKSGQAMMIYE